MEQIQTEPIPPFNSASVRQRAGIKIKFIRNISDRDLYLPKKKKNASFFSTGHRLFSKSPSPWKFEKFRNLHTFPLPSPLPPWWTLNRGNRVPSRFFPQFSRGEIVGASKDCIRGVRLCVPRRICAYYVINWFAPRFEISGVTRVECLAED